jgi:hypothetical protein
MAAPDNRILEPTKKTPWLILEKGRILIIGRSISENPEDFYRPVYDWISEYITDNEQMTEIQLGFEFINTASIKWVYAVLKQLATIPDIIRRAKITWYYEEGDDDMCDLGLILRSMVSCPFQIIEVEDINKHTYDQNPDQFLV